MRAADISGLIQQSQDGGADYAQGTVLEFDSDTGENAVSVNGSVLENLPILNTGEAITLKPTHVVGLLKWKSQWFILGRITVAGSGQFASASTLAISDLAFVTGLSFSTSFVTKASITLPVPHWANRAVLTASCTYGLTNNSGGQDNIIGLINWQANNWTSFGGTGGGSQTIPAGFFHQLTLGGNDEFDVTGADDLTVWTQASTSDPWPAGDSGVTLFATLIFRSTL